MRTTGRPAIGVVVGGSPVLTDESVLVLLVESGSVVAVSVEDGAVPVPLFSPQAASASARAPSSKTARLMSM